MRPARGTPRPKPTDMRAEVSQIVVPLIEGAGFEVVQVEVVGAHAFPALRILIDRLPGAGFVSVDDCVRVTRLLEEVPALDDLFPATYQLEVSSPGVNRPLVKPAHFERFVGEKVSLTLVEALDGRKNFVGRLQGLEGELVRVDVGKGVVVSIPFGTIHKAHLKPDTAELFKRAAARGQPEFALEAVAETAEDK